jgi:muramoyltetrapeptide carboxypeptidase
MKVPEYLKKGDTIGLVSPSRLIKQDEVVKAIEVFRTWGLHVLVGKNCFQKKDQFAGSDEQRAEDFQEMLDNKDVKAIFCTRGGYGAVRVIDRLDFTGFIRNPKWIAGFSDITVLHNHINQNFGVVTLHCEMPLNFGKAETSHDSIETIRKALFGENLAYKGETTDYLIEGSGGGILTGGNLSVIYSLLGSVSEIQTDGKILFLEDLDEYLYHVDRMLMALKRAGKFNGLKGLILGGMTEMKDNAIPFGKTPQQMVYEVCREMVIPLICDFPAGHLKVNLALKLGNFLKLEVQKNSYSLIFE